MLDMGPRDRERETLNENHSHPRRAAPVAAALGAYRRGFLFQINLYKSVDIVGNQAHNGFSK